MSPKSKRMSIKEKVTIDSGCSQSLTEETNETDSDNYNKSDEFSGILKNELTCIFKFGFYFKFYQMKNRATFGQ
jgi:hypothetical protein